MVRGRDRGGFTRFRDGEDKGLFPDRREVRRIEGKVKQGSKVGNGAFTKMLQVDHGHVVRADG